MREHTEGSWSISALQPAYIIGPGPKYHVVASVAEFRKNGEVEMLFCGEEAMANALLIAAAPDLLKTLRIIADFAVGNGDVCEIIAKRARAAISKATP